MHDHKLGALAVVADGRVVGILTATDVIQAVVGSPESSGRDRTGASR
jgi:CBS domain-containing protein